MVLTLDDWANAAQESLLEVLRTFEPAEDTPSGGNPVVVGIALQGRPGAAISLIVEPGAACGVARQFLGLEPDDENPDRSEIEDCMKELMNMVAGVAKRKLISQDASIALGLPRSTERPRSAEARSIEVCLGKNIEGRMIAHPVEQFVAA